jgi:hypothetical protein
MKYHTALVFSFLLLLLMFIIALASVIMSRDHRHEVFAQNADSLELEKVLIGDVIQDLQKNDTKSATIHLDLAERQLSLFPSNLSSKEEIKLLVKDASEALRNNDTHSAILHLNIAAKQISKPVEQLITNTTQKSPQKAHPDLSAGPAVVNLTILDQAYFPNPVKVKKGDEIQVTNKDSVYQYTATNDNRSNDEEPGKLFDTGIINPGQSAKFNTSKLVEGQKYSFHDKTKAGVKGVLEVVKLDTERSKTVPHIQVTKPRETLGTTKMTEMKKPNLTNTTHPVISETTKYLTYLDNDAGFSIQYPEDWKADNQNLSAYFLVVLKSPDSKANLIVKLFPQDKNQTLKSFGDTLKNDETYKISTYYRNSTTKLSGLPAIRTTGTAFNTVSKFQEALGYQSSTSKDLLVWTLDEDKNGFFGLVFISDKANYDRYLPVANHMIETFKIMKSSQKIQEE